MTELEEKFEDGAASWGQPSISRVMLPKTDDDGDDLKWRLPLLLWVGKKSWI